MSLDLVDNVTNLSMVVEVGFMVQQRPQAKKGSPLILPNLKINAPIEVVRMVLKY